MLSESALSDSAGFYVQSIKASIEGQHKEPLKFPDFFLSYECYSFHTSGDEVYEEIQLRTE